MKKLLATTALIGLTASSLYAGCTSTGCSDVTVEKLYMTYNGTLYVGTSGDEKKLNCGSAETAGVYMSLKEGDVGKNAMYSLLLTAKTTGKKVKVRIQEGTPDCRVLYVTAD